MGAKNLMDLYPSRVRDKILADAKPKQFDEFNKKALADVAREVAEFEGKNSSKSRSNRFQNFSKNFPFRFQQFKL